MILACELSNKWGARVGGNSVEFLDRDFASAISELLERAAQEAEAEAQSLTESKVTSRIAARIRALSGDKA